MNAQVPSDVDTASEPIVVTTVGGASDPFPITVNALQPGLLAPAAFNIIGHSICSGLFPDGVTYVLPGAIAGVPTRRAKPGDTIILYGVGFGPVTPGNPAGVIVQAVSNVNASFHYLLRGQTRTRGLRGAYGGIPGAISFQPGSVGCCRRRCRAADLPVGWY